MGLMKENTKEESVDGLMSNGLIKINKSIPLMICIGMSVVVYVGKEHLRANDTGNAKEREPFFTKEHQLNMNKK